MKIIYHDAVLAFRRAKGMCECSRLDHEHQGRCSNPVLWRSQGLRTPLGILFGVWQVRHIIDPNKGGNNHLKNIEVLCWTCNRKLRNRIYK